MSIFRKTCDDYLEEFGAGALALEHIAALLCALFFFGFWMMTP